MTQGRGYVVRLDGHSFDVHRAGELLVSARDALREAAPPRAVDLASEVVALYRGEPYADVAYQDWIQPEVHRLNELRMEATEVLYAARLELGHHGELIAALESLVAAHPLRERLRGLLMLALYRAGRQADALRCFSAGRAALVDELGIEPGPELRELERRILEQDRTLDARIEPVRAVVASGVIGRARATARADGCVASSDDGRHARGPGPWRAWHREDGARELAHHRGGSGRRDRRPWSSAGHRRRAAVLAMDRGTAVDRGSAACVALQAHEVGRRSARPAGSGARRARIAGIEWSAVCVHVRLGVAAAAGGEHRRSARPRPRRPPLGR